MVSNKKKKGVSSGQHKEFATGDRQAVPTVRQMEGVSVPILSQIRAKPQSTVRKPLARNVQQKKNFDCSPFIWSGKYFSSMLSHCANLQCRKPFLRLREGKLFLVETERTNKPGEPSIPLSLRARQQQRFVEHYWLCDDCAVRWTLVYDPECGIALAPVRRPVSSTSAPARTGIA